jgi:demethylmenaquinone methyltransferase/2-methoxy-6-polyprenyl-1,4-benzoquinol methylase
MISGIKVRRMPNGSEMDRYIQKLDETYPLREPTIRNAINTLSLPLGSVGLDVGCGIGWGSILLAEAVGNSGRVTGLDISPEILDKAEYIVARAGYCEQINFKQGDMKKLPFEDNTFDWVWSVDCVGYAPIEPPPLIKELVRVVRPGGIVAIVAWSSEQLLPGYPRLEARLNATRSGVAPFKLGLEPEMHFLRALGWFRSAGIREPRGLTLAASFSAPLRQEIRAGLEAIVQMRWTGLDDELLENDMALFKRLFSPESQDFLLNQPDYYAFFTYTMFFGLV